MNMDEALRIEEAPDAGPAAIITPRAKSADGISFLVLFMSAS
jgi:hypothetical protein